MSLALLETQEIVMQFGGIRAVDNASISVEAGRVAALIGPNGAGKTTTFNIISGLQEPTSGTVVFDGRDITDVPVHGRARLGIARTFQRLEVFGSLSVRENILTAAEIHASWGNPSLPPSQKADQLLDLIGLRSFADQRADAIPTGIARMTELGRALATEPRLVLLDEPGSGLAEEEAHEFGQLLLRLAGEGMGILMVEHDVDLVMQVSSWIDVLDFGQIIASGPPAEIRENKKVQAAYLGAETAEAS